MAKGRKIFTINDFSGGLNNNASTTNLKPNESAQLTNLKTTETGTLATIQDAEPANTIYDNLPDHRDAVGQQHLNGRGIFGHPHDYSLKVNGETGDKNNNEYIVYHPHPETFSIDCHSRVSKSWIPTKLQFRNSKETSDGLIPSSGKMIPAYYVHNGTARICDSDFENDITPQYHGYISQKMFKNSSGTALQTLDKWAVGPSTIKSFEDLEVPCKWVNADSYNPKHAVLGDKHQITLAVKNAEKVGSWNGQYLFGITPIYNDGQEGPITKVGKVNKADGLASAQDYFFGNNSAMSIEVFITIGTTNAPATGEYHILKDERITGIRVYVQKSGSESWYMLIDTTLEDGEKKTNWLHSYNAQTDEDKGIINSGDITVTDWGSTVSVASGSKTVRADFGTDHADMNGMNFIMAIQGFYLSPLYVPFTKGTSQTQDIVVTEVVNPLNSSGGSVDSTFTFSLLRQNYMPMLVKSITQAISSATTQPPTYAENSDKVLYVADEYDSQERDY
tara:strand:- start:3413 stop:4927 length:1515 start_codon:yes stop_codon:yes gene_type:complete